jgi:hypothetical protein
MDAAGGGLQVVLPPRAVESKGQRIGRQNEYFKEEPVFSTLQILNY